MYSSSFFLDSRTAGLTEDEAFGDIHDWTRFNASERDMSTVLWIVSGSMSSSASAGIGCAELDAIAVDRS